MYYLDMTEFTVEVIRSIVNLVNLRKPEENTFLTIEINILWMIFGSKNDNTTAE